MEYNYENDLAIDPHLLDEEFLKQPVLYMKYGELSAKANFERDQAKEKMEAIKAEIDSDIRSNPNKYGLGKITEGSISATILTQQKYKDALTEYNNKNLDSSRIQTAVRAFDHRKSALENLVKLWIGEYFSTPRENNTIAPGKRLLDEIRDKSAQNQREGLNRRRAI